MRQPGLSIDWTKHIKDDEAKRSFEQSIRGSTVALSRLRDLIRERLKIITSMETRISDYDTPSWSAKQAHRNGQRSALAELEQLLSFLDLKE